MAMYYREFIPAYIHTHTHTHTHTLYANVYHNFVCNSSKLEMTQILFSRLVVVLQDSSPMEYYSAIKINEPGWRHGSSDTAAA
jgi:hypothetical protein